ncbi:hypothetical protein BU15DRAFT_87547 [Melanogaster broomeanus]|nr:hypothetical protein BU15DRAFT_87547 [Melanogaster broomeanus]
MSTSIRATTEEESAELIKFREEWKHEVRRRREEQQAQEASTAISNQQNILPPESHTRLPTNHRTTVLDGEGKPQPARSVAGVPQQSVHTSHGHSQLSGLLTNAVEIYRSAVHQEQESNLDEALRLYRKAFRLNPDVDRAYFKEQERLQQLGRSKAGAGDRKTVSAGRTAGAEAREAHVTRAEARDKVPSTLFLPSLLAAFPEILTFEPEDERGGVPINMIPEESLLYILRSLDTTTLERFATVSRKARVLSLDSSIWRDFVYMAYKPPQIPETETVETIVDRYNANYRRTYIEHPRLRLDGVYIAVCHYVRRGLSENAWINISHLITYHRYLRFYPDGRVLSLLANEEYQPSHGFYIGDWRMEGSVVQISNLCEMHTSVNAASTHSHNHIPQPRPSAPSRFGRWNKLDLVSYESVNIEDGEVVPLPLKHERPFWFSKVTSWQGYC